MSNAEDCRHETCERNHGRQPGTHVYLYRWKMTREQLPDDEMFISAEAARKSYEEADTGDRSQNQHDQSSFFRIGNTAGCSHSEYGAIQTAAG
jgi:hypothetical protein